MKAGDLIAVLDPSELQAQEAAATAAIFSLQHKVAEMEHTEASTKGLDHKRCRRMPRPSCRRQGTTDSGECASSIVLESDSRE